MSQPQRYRGLTYEEKMFGGAKPPFPADLMIDPEGNLVAYSDYAALAAENKRLKDDLAKWVNLSAEHEKEVAQLQAKVADLEARCRLLRRLGDEMYEALDDGEPNPILVDWYFAKQGM